ncbi:MAG TPA: fructosamine kinase family protein [Phototrophicaceae bacterium]|jgi:fructosamine-3-kinase|nr:fructosamine kinase family protein [Phototrophicaceae bacterium]
MSHTIPDIPTAIATFLASEGAGEVISADLVTGGNINQIRRIMTASGASFILKQNASAGIRLFECEAGGLQILRETGMRTPDVLAVGTDFLLMEDLGSRPDQEPDWEELGRMVARQHLHTSPDPDGRFGFDYDNYLGPLPQINTWSNDGHEFFGQHRVLRYLSEPLCEQALTAQDRQNLERLVKRLPELIPVQPPSLLHGDLWHTNMLVDSQGIPTVIDPAVYYGWAEAELSMTYQYGHGKVPRTFYDAYNEINPLTEGWWDRLELLTIRQCMAVLAFFGNRYNTLDELRGVISKFS